MSDEQKSDFGARIAALPQLNAILAQRVIDAGISTLEDLECAAYDGRLERISGFGAKRIEQVRRELDRQLSHTARPTPGLPRPSVATLLAIDAEYRQLAAMSLLPRIAPRRFNPEHRAWLPIWHTMRDGWSFTVMYSNTAQAFAVGKRRDWTIIVYQRDGAEDHCTVVTEYRGPLERRRVVRGREEECEAWYGTQSISPEVRVWAHKLSEWLSSRDSALLDEERRDAESRPRRHAPPVHPASVGGGAAKRGGNAAGRPRLHPELSLFR
ncbi:MAG: helix-hairpin-helix domain-containing protein [Proteobacteria bacterium]|nr:helix-hairpin-helix domain-containing protein [Pseudomonadota bacterium]